MDAKRWDRDRVCDYETETTTTTGAMEHHTERSGWIGRKRKQLDLMRSESEVKLKKGNAETTSNA